MHVRLVDGGMPYEEEDTCIYVRLVCASHTWTGVGGAGADIYDLYVHHTPGREPEEQEQEQGQARLLLLLLLRCAWERATTEARP
jgi:hypothetical protein